MSSAKEDLQFQRSTAADILEMAVDDGHECDLIVEDLLDYMGILGVSFASGDDASKAYIDGLAEQSE